MKSKKQLERERAEHRATVAGLENTGWKWTQDFPTALITVLIKEGVFVTVKKGKIHQVLSAKIRS